MAGEATAEEVKKPEGQPAPGAGSPSAKTPAETGAPESKPAATEKGPSPEAAEKKTGKAADVAFFHARKAQTENEKLRSENEELKKKLASSPEPKKEAPAEAAPSWSDDPDAWAKDVQEKAKQQAEKAALDAIERREREGQVRQEVETASAWLLTRSHLREDPKLKAEVAQRIQAEYGELADRHPSRAARLAYLDVCEAKGITPDLESYRQESAAAESAGRASAGARPSASSAGEKKAWTRREAEKYVFEAKPGTAEFNARLKEIEEAGKEGRIS